MSMSQAKEFAHRLLPSQDADVMTRTPRELISPAAIIDRSPEPVGVEDGGGVGQDYT